MTAFNTIRSRNDLADYLNIPPSILSYVLFVKKVDSFYYSFDIPKKSGGVRHIHASTDELKDIQIRLAHEIWEHQKSIYEDIGIKPNVAHAFIEDKSIITNAKIHRNKRFVVNVDLKDFFDSIHIGRICGFFERNKYYNLPHEVAVTIAQLACFNGKLPQGAPTSPVITNVLCQVLDVHVLAIAKKFKLDYTRYADDLTFSTNKRGFIEKDWELFYSELQKEIIRSGFVINEKKVRIQFKDSKQTVTGLVVNKKVNIDSKYYKQTRAMAHSLYSTGAYNIDGNPGTMQQLEGRFSFIDQIDKYNNANDVTGKHSFRTLNARERQYQKFLYFKYFYSNERPLIVTEGKTDIKYLKVALKNLHKQYPTLIEKDKGGKFVFKVAFLRRSKRLNYFFDFSQDGADAIKKIYNFSSDTKDKAFTNYQKLFAEKHLTSSTNPVIFVFDNEISNKNKPLYNFMVHAKLSDHNDNLSKALCLRIHPNTNLYIATNPLVSGKDESEIEELFGEEVRSVILGGKTLSLKDDFDTEKYFGKEIFANYISTNYKTIDFSGFIPLLDTIKAIVDSYNQSKSDTQ